MSYLLARMGYVMSEAEAPKKLGQFSAWQRGNLAGHRAVTYGAIVSSASGERAFAAVTTRLSLRARIQAKVGLHALVPGMIVQGPKVDPFLVVHPCAPREKR